MHRQKLILANTVFRYASIALGIAVTFVLTPFLIRSLGKEMLGLQTLAGQALQFVGLLATALGVSYNRFATTAYAKGDYAEMNDVAGCGFWFSAVSSILFVVGTCITALFAKTFFSLSPEILTPARFVIIITGFSSALSILIGVWTVPVYVSQRLYWTEIVNAIALVGSAIAVVVAFQLSTASIVIWALLANGSRLGVMLFILLPVARKLVPQFKPQLSLAHIGTRSRKLLSFGAMSALGGLGYLLYYATDSILISNLSELGPGKILEYNLGQRWDPLIRMLIMGFAGVLTPTLTSLAGTGKLDQVRRIFLRATKYSLALALLPCMLLIAFSKPLMTHWVGNDFLVNSVDIMRLVLAGTILSVPAIVGYEVLVACARIKQAVISTILAGVLNILLSIFFVKVMGLGLKGLAISTLLTMSLRNALYTPFLMRQATGLGILEFFNRGCLSALNGILPVVAVSYLLRCTWEPENLGVVFIQFFISSAVYVPALWFITFDESDRQRVHQGISAVVQKYRTLFPKAI